MLMAVAVAAAAACGRGDRRDVAAADSLNRDLQLAPVDTTATLNDQPSATPAPAETPAQPAPKPAAPKPKPKPTTPAAAPAPSPAAAPAPTPAAAARSLASGTTLSASTQSEIRSHKNKVGDEIMATVDADVKDQAGHVVIPAGSTVTLTVTAIKESENKGDSTGTLTLKPSAVSVNGNSYPLSATIERVNTRLEGRKTNAGDIAKVGGGTAAGAVVGRVLGGSTKGAIIGGIIGGAVGAQRAVETKDRDVVLPQGTAVTMTLSQTFVAEKS
jgi:hypothetical protein